MADQAEKQKEEGRRIRALRDRMGFDRDVFAAKLGIKAKTLAQVELGYQKLGRASRIMLEQLDGSVSGAPPRPPRGEAVSGAAVPSDAAILKVIEFCESQENHQLADQLADVLAIDHRRALLLMIREKLNGFKE